MNQMELYSSVRELIGNPDPNQLTNRQLDRHLLPALNWLCAQLKFTLETEPNLLLVAEQAEYPLPRDVAWLVSVDWNSQKLEPTTTYRLDREQTNWRYASGGNPVEFVMVAGDRHLVLNPKPSAAAIALAPAVTLRYISTAPGIDPSGTPQLGDLDQELLVYKTAQRYLRSHITAESAQDYGAKIQSYQAEIDDLLPAAKRRIQNPIEDFFPSFTVEHGRIRGAR